MADVEHDEVGAAVDELWSRSPCPLLGSHDGGVVLWAWAEDVARECHRRYPSLEITLGYLRYPERAPEEQVDFDSFYARLGQLDPAELEVSLDGPLTVVSGHDGDHALIVSNHAKVPFVVSTNGRITAQVVDASTGRIVGISTMAQSLPGVLFRVEPGEKVSIPLRVGTASVDPDLSYAVPAGHWALRANVSLLDDHGNRTERRTPPLSFEIN